MKIRTSSKVLLLLSLLASFQSFSFGDTASISATIPADSPRPDRRRCNGFISGMIDVKLIEAS